MALNRIPIQPDAARDAKARELAKTAHTWNVVTLKQDWGAFKKGDQALQTPNGYRVNAVWCECPDYATWGNICKHIRCVVLLDRQNVTPALASEAETDLAFAEAATRLRGHGAGAAIIKRYEDIWADD